MKIAALSTTCILALLAAPAFAQDSASAGGEMSAQTELVGNMGKIEANIAESQARLFTHMLLPSDNPEREAYGEAFKEDLDSVDSYLSEVQNSDLPDGATDEIERFASEWNKVKEMAQGLTTYSRDNLAPVEEIQTYANAVLELDDYIDAALVAAGLPDDDDGPDATGATGAASGSEAMPQGSASGSASGSATTGTGTTN
ncbi:hypothetical protein DYI37_15655 [Fulvimarina endophytica]|uniref:Uncharacterized protein n=1 Tax=Fulvimarina endophytica TaxID=2293836 RepID=A0A371X088_9HYPH|nr:hypothetical protein [Fulvimarina endophytica]RFC62661.1 hypothetical protein DYI37_15655 [Fulvimarina endophytica]